MSCLNLNCYVTIYYAHNFLLSSQVYMCIVQRLFRLDDQCHSFLTYENMLHTMFFMTNTVQNIKTLFLIISTYLHIVHY